MRACHAAQLKLAFKGRRLYVQSLRLFVVRHQEFASESENAFKNSSTTIAYTVQLNRLRW